MPLKPFLLDAWVDQYEHNIEFNLAPSTGPTWTASDMLALADEKTRQRLLNHKLVYSRPAGADSLREAIAEMQHVPVAVQIVTWAPLSPLGRAGLPPKCLSSDNDPLYRFHPWQANLGILEVQKSSPSPTFPCPIRSWKG